MNPRGSLEFEPRVQRMLRKLGIDVPPVPVEKIAKFLKAEVRVEPAEHDLSGALLRVGKTAVIGVNSHHPRVRQRFTIGHELGHLILHSDLGREVHMDDARSMGVVELPGKGVVQVLFRDELSSAAVDSKEIEANRFAAVLLMPAKFLAESLREVPIPVSEASVRVLARAYNVSTVAMQYRLINLGVPVGE